MIRNNTVVVKNLLLLFLIFGGVHYAKAFLIPLSISGILATLFLPFCKWLEKKIPKGLAVFVCLLTLLVVVITIGAFLGWQISELVNDIALIKQKTIDIFTKAQVYIIENLGISLIDQTQLLKDEQPSVSGLLQMMLGSFVNLFTNFILILFYVFFLLYYRAHIKKFLLKLTAKEKKKEKKKEMEQVIYETTHISQQYLVGLSKIIGCLWVMYGIGFSILGVPNALFFAILCGLLEIVPFIGNFTGTTLTVLVTATHGASLPLLGGIVLTYGLVQFIQGWVLEPLILGPQVKINPLFTIIALVLGQLVWGISGIILAIPLTAIFKIICDHIEPLKPYGFLIGKIENNA